MEIRFSNYYPEATIRNHGQAKVGDWNSLPKVNKYMLKE